MNDIFKISYKSFGTALWPLHHVKVQGEACDLEEDPPLTTQAT